MTSIRDARRAVELIERAEQARLDGDYRAGVAHARRAAAFAEAAGDGAAQARALRSLANQQLRLGEHEDAVRTCRDAVIVLERIDDPAGVCEVLTIQALAYDTLGMHQEALAVLDRGRTIAQELHDHTLLYWVHNRTGVVHGSMGDRVLSTDYLMRALSMSEGLDDEARFCILNNVGDNAVHRATELLRDGDDPAAARTLNDSLSYVEEAVRLARAAGHPYREALSLDNHGMLLALAGQYETAEQMIDDARRIAAVHGYRSIESGALQHLARIRRMRGQHEAAVLGLHAALEEALAAGEMPMAMEIHRELSDAYEKTGDFAPALRHYREYHRMERLAHNDVAAARGRMAAHLFELDNAKLEAEKARLESELHRIRTAELEADRQVWQEQATLDPLTGLPNRRCAEARLAELSAAGHFCLAVADVDHFKTVNDRYGHPAGDEVLRRLATILRDGVRDSDLVARMGGEEFLLALDSARPDEAAARCELLRAEIAGYPWHTVHPGMEVTISIGVVEVPFGTDLDVALKTADQHLYRAKRAGRNRVLVG
jgi:diguanylate cyclase (GGDEF)-like protein